MNAASDNCLHCGTPVPPQASDPRFCCTGCAYVYDLLHTQGLDQFYDLRGMAPLPPVPAQAMRQQDYSWLQGLTEQAESAAGIGGTAHTRLAIQGITCIGCVWLLERVFQSMAGGVRLGVHLTRGEVDVEWRAGSFDMPHFAEQVQQFGYLLGRPEAASAEGVQSSSFKKRTGLCGAFALNAMAFSLPAYLGMERGFMFASWFDLIAAGSATLSLLVGGSYFFEKSLQSLRHGLLHMDTPITLGIGSAWIGSMVGWLADVPSLKYFDFVSIFVFLMLAGRWMQQAAVERNRKRLLQSSAVPETVTLLGEDQAERVAPLTEITPGAHLSVAPGEIFPVACTLESSQASLSLEWINGESRATRRTVGQVIPSGALNIGSRAVHTVAQEPWAESLLHRLATSDTAADQAPAYFARLLRGYLISVVILGVAGALTWWLLGRGTAAALQVLISVFVVSCPCALGVAAPFADDLAASWMQRLGVFVRHTSIWQRLARVRQIVFDKTGTLTLENPVLQDPTVLQQLTPEAKAALRHLTSCNLHPVSRSLFDAVGPMPAVDSASEVEEITGQGLRFTDAEGKAWALGRPGWCGGRVPATERPQTELRGDAELTLNGTVLAAFSFTDALRPETVRACATLREQGMALHLFSGDRPEKVALVAQTLQIPQEHWHGSMHPEEKAAEVRRINQGDTLFIGDGANDSLALEAALCAGSPVTSRNFLEHKADFYFLGNSLRFVPQLLEISRRRRRAVRRVFIFALGYNLVAVALSLAGYMSPLLAAILMPASSLVTLAIARVSFGTAPRMQGEMATDNLAPGAAILQPSTP